MDNIIKNQAEYRRFSGELRKKIKAMREDENISVHNMEGNPKVFCRSINSKTVVKKCGID